MQQAALNLIAIGIFGTTMSILLGPMLNISPAIPALTTVGILSIATLDTLSFQGKGVTVLLDWVAGFSPGHRDRIIRHEAGHFLVAYLLGIPITGYTLTAWEALKNGQPGLGGVIFDTEKLSPNVLAPLEMQLTLERFCTVWMAGIAAENLAYGNVEGGGEDRHKLREALSLWGRQEAEFVQKERWATRQAETIIGDNKDSYEALVEAMKQRTSVAECFQIIKLNCQK
ncbi:MAG: ATP-dependent Zn protease [Coleofasciculaceae cyanobacterium]